MTSKAAAAPVNGLMADKGKAAPSTPEKVAAPAAGPLIAVSLKLDPDDHHWLRMHAAQHRKKHQAILLEAFREYRAKHGG